MVKPAVILHGWADGADSFRALARWLKDAGAAPVEEIFLGDYLSMNDEVTLFDLGCAFRRALQRHGVPQTRHGFNLLVHSTGALVAREYLRQVCRDPVSGERSPARSPIAHLVMFAPANFGSPLAPLGKSILGRVFKGWKWDGFGESGRRILDALELASPEGFDLAQDDLFNPGFRVFAPENTCATVLAGTVPYPDALRSSLHENGGDGTVRVSTANLNAGCFHIDFSPGTGVPELRERQLSCEEVALAVLHRNHGSIVDPDDPVQASDWRDVVRGALACGAAGYAAHRERCRAVTERTYAEGLRGPDPHWYHAYQHIAVRVRDQHGAPIDDYMIELYQESDDADAVFKTINGAILEKVTRNRAAPNMRSFYLDISDLRDFLAQNPAASVALSISAAHVSRRIKYRNPARGVEIFRPGCHRFLRPNGPLLLDITLPRDPEVDSEDHAANVFQIRRG